MQDILITPGSGEPQILFRGSGVNDTAVELNVLSSYQSATGSGSALLFEGEQGQLFAITDNLSSGVIFSVADITGLPAIEYNASGELKLGEYASNITLYSNNGLVLNSGTPSSTTDSLYNTSGTLYFNGSPYTPLPPGGLESQILYKVNDSSNELAWIDNYATELRELVKNDTGSGILKGTVVMATGAVGDRIQVAPAVADGTVEPRYMLGVTSEAIDTGAEGYVSLVGPLKGIPTSGWPVGTILWIDPSTPGGLTSTQPTAPDLQMSVAIVTNQHASNGRIFVRMWEQQPGLHELHDVNVDTVSSGDIIAYDSSNGVWKNTPSPVPYTGAITSVDLGSNSLTAGSGAFTSVDLTGGTITTSRPLIDATQTWDDAGVVFTALKLNVTNTASSSSSRLLDLQVGGSSQFYINRSGTIYALNYGRFYTKASAQQWSIGTEYPDCLTIKQHTFPNARTVVFRTGYTPGILINADWQFQWNASVYSNAPCDIALARDAAGILAQRVSTSPQAFRIYNTYTDASNGEWAEIDWKTTSNVLRIGSNNNGTGTARDVAIQHGGNVVANFLSDRFYLGPIADGTTVGGNARGQYAVDLQLSRTAATQVASGNYAFVIGYRNTASGLYSFASGQNCIASATQAFSTGVNCVSSGVGGFSHGQSSIASGTVSFAANSSTASGNGSFSIGTSVATRPSQFSHSSGRHSVIGDGQYIRLVGGTKTTDGTPLNIKLSAINSSSGSNNWLSANAKLLTITAGTVLAFTAKISGIKSDGTAAAFYTRKGCIKNVGGTTTLVGSIETIGTDIEDSATAVAITADDTNDALDIQVTGIAAETWRWVAVIEGVEIAYGT